MMEKDPIIQVPETYEKLSSEECIDRTGNRKRSITNKSWCFLIAFTLVAVVVAFLSLCTLQVEVSMLQTKVALLQKVVEEDLKIVMNLERLVVLHMKEEIERKVKQYNKDKSDSPDYSISRGESNEDDDNADDVDYEEDGRDDEDEADDNDDDDEVSKAYGKSKTKREIREHETSDDKEVKNGANGTVLKSLGLEKKSNEKTSTKRTSAERTSTETYSSETYTSRERFIPAVYRLSRKSHSRRKHRKFRIGSAERFYTDIHSTTSAPIQVRRSRTKATETHETERKPWLNTNPMLQQHTSSNRDTITKEEAVLKGYGKYLDDNDNSYDLETPRERGPDALSYNMITIHFSADTSHYSRDRDPHYFGNGRMQIKSEVYKDWKPAHWTQGIGMSKYFHLNQGRVTVSTTGIYLIYAQIQYSNVQEVNGFSVFRNNEIVVQCITTSTHPDKQEIKSNTCGISTTILLQSNDSVCIKDLHHGRYVVLTPEKSYFGLVLLSPFKK